MSEYIGRDWFNFVGFQDMASYEEERLQKTKKRRRYELRELDFPLSEIIKRCYNSFVDNEYYENYPIKGIAISLIPRNAKEPMGYINEIHITFEKGITDEDYVLQLIKVIDEIDLVIEYFILWTDTKKVKNSRRRISGTTRQNVLMRDNYTCQICGATVKDGAKLEIDHIIPYSKGGTNKENNLQVLCQQCNREKHNRSDLLHDELKLAELKGDFIRDYEARVLLVKLIIASLVRVIVSGAGIV